LKKKNDLKKQNKFLGEIALFSFYEHKIDILLGPLLG